MPVLSNAFAQLAPTTLTLVSDAITVTQGQHIVAAETSTTDNLATINLSADLPTTSGSSTYRYTVRLQANTGHTITVKHGTGNISLNTSADYTLSGSRVLELTFNGTNWIDVQSSASVASVGVSTNATYLTVGSSPITTTGTITVNKTTGLTANQVVATPDGTTGAADLRALVANDIPNLDAGKITSGTFDAARLPTIAETKGGTNQTSYATGDILYASATNTLAKLNVGTEGHVLTVSSGVPSWQSNASGSVNSVALSLPSEFSVSGSPVTTSGTLTGAWQNQTANQVLAGPTTGSATAPSFRALVADDVPSLDASKITTGTLDSARVPDLAASRITAGTFPSGAYTFTTSISAPVISATNTSVATEGSNVAVNGTFDTDTSWTKGTGWTISGGVATKTAGTAANLSQSLTGLAANQVVRIRFSYTRTAGTLTVSCGGVTHSSSFTAASANADIYIRTTGAGALTFIADATFAGTVDAVQANIITVRTLPVQIPTTGTDNWSLGANALENVTTGDGNYALGVNALRDNTTGRINLAIGTGALQAHTTGNSNTAIGYNALLRNTVGNSNTAIGREALRDSTTAVSNTAIGTNALFLTTTGGYNTAIGEAALSANTTGSLNTGVGRNALTANTTGVENTAIGVSAGQANTTGYRNVAIGRNSFFANTTGFDNTAIGTEALRSGTAISSCVAIGYQAGRDETNSNRLYIHNSLSTTPLIFGIFSGTGAGLTIHSQNTAGVPLIVKGIASQSSNLQQWQDSTGAVLGFVSASGGLVVNESGADADTRIEGDTDVNLLFVDASADSVQVGSATTADSAKFYVSGKISGSGEFEINGDLNHDGSNVGFYGTAPAGKPTVTGSRGANAALESLLTGLASLGLITDSSTA
jgi:hypothetical protein